MKKFLSKLFILIMMLGLVIPTLAYAEGDDEEEVAETREPVTVYLFRGEGCPHCEDALEWFNSDEVQEEYGQYFTIESYEVWNDEENSDLMNTVAEYMGENLEKLGVPYILIGEHTTAGFDTDNDPERFISWIMEEYEKDSSERYLAVPAAKEATGWGQKPNTTVRDIIIVASFVVIVLGVVFVTIKARKDED